MPTGDRKSITVAEETYDQLQAERADRGNPKWDVFLQHLLADEDTPVLDVPEDMDVWREHSVGNDDIADLEERLDDVERRLDDLPNRVVSDLRDELRR